MPIYTYGCEGCGNATDLIRPIASKDDPVECPNGCGPMKSLIAVPAGLIGRAVAPGAVPPSEVPGADTSGGRAFPHVITNLRANNNDGAAVAIEGPWVSTMVEAKGSPRSQGQAGSAAGADAGTG